MFERVHVVLYRRVRPGFDPQPQPGKKQQIKATMPQLLQIFSGLDADGSGCLTREEVAGVPLDVLPPNVLEHVSVDNMEDLFEVWLGIGWSC